MSQLSEITVEEFASNVKLIKHKDGSFTLRCRKGLWAVSGNDLAQVNREGLHYYVQYREDGEYEPTTTGEEG